MGNSFVDKSSHCKCYLEDFAIIKKLKRGSDKEVYLALIMDSKIVYNDLETKIRQTTVGQKYISALLGYSPRTVNRAIKTLKDIGIVIVKKRGSAEALYTITVAKEKPKGSTIDISYISEPVLFPVWE